MTKPWFEEATELLAKATPGPWEWNAADGSINDVKDGEWVAFAEPCGDMNSRIVAEPYDALLIAAAPTLLKAALEEREGHQARWQSDAKWIAELSEERERLCTALAKYGTHQGDTCCGHEFGSIVQGHCDCGLDTFEPNEPKP